MKYKVGDVVRYLGWKQHEKEKIGDFGFTGDLNLEKLIGEKFIVVGVCNFDFPYEISQDEDDEDCKTYSVWEKEIDFAYDKIKLEDYL